MMMMGVTDEAGPFNGEVTAPLTMMKLDRHEGKDLKKTGGLR